MELSGAAVAVQPTAVEVNAREINFKKQVSLIKTSDLPEVEKVAQIKLLTHTTELSIFQRKKRLQAIVLRDSNFVGRIAEYADLSLNYTNEMHAQETREGLDLADPIPLTRFFYNMQRMLTPEENNKICQYIELMINDKSTSVKRHVEYATNEEIEQCFSQIGVNVYETNLSSIRKAIEDRIPSKEDVEITARAIERPLRMIPGNDFTFPAFSDGNYIEELHKTIQAEDFQSNAITQLDFIDGMPFFLKVCPIKVFPNILGAFKNLTHLGLFHCTSLTMPPNLSGNPNLKTLHISGCTSLTTAPDVSQNPLLKWLEFWNCTSLLAAPDVSQNPLLLNLDFKGCTRLTKFPDLSKVTRLVSLNVSGVFPEESRLNRSAFGNKKVLQLISEIEGYEVLGEIPVLSPPKTVFDHLAIFFTTTIPNFFRAIADFFRNFF